MLKAQSIKSPQASREWGIVPDWTAFQFDSVGPSVVLPVQSDLDEKETIPLYCNAICKYNARNM